MKNDLNTFKSLILLLFAVSLISFGCNKKTVVDTNNEVLDTGSALDFEKALYKQSYKNGDHSTAVMAINRILLLDSTQTQYYDSASRHYIALGNANSAAYFAEKAISLDPGDVRMLEIAGYVYFETQAFRKSEEKFSKLYQITNDVKYLYQLAQIYAYMGEIKRSNEMTDIIINDSSADDIYVDVATSTGAIQTVKIKAATYFVKANLVESNSQILSYLNKALSIQPDYDVVKQIKEDMQVQTKMKEIKANEALLEKYRNR